VGDFGKLRVCYADHCPLQNAQVSKCRPTHRVSFEGLYVSKTSNGRIGFVLAKLPTLNIFSLPGRDMWEVSGTGEVYKGFWWAYLIENSHL